MFAAFLLLGCGTQHRRAAEFIMDAGVRESALQRFAAASNNQRRCACRSRCMGFPYHAVLPSGERI
ncbi:hypothetical protein PSAC2689_40430 [Paraburkholderia sacchari]